MKQIFIKTNTQKKWLQTLSEEGTEFSTRSADTDEQSKFPKENIDVLVNLGYTSLPLPQTYGGKGIGIYDMVLFQETIASSDAATGLSIGWHMGVTGELYEKNYGMTANWHFLRKKC